MQVNLTRIDLVCVGAPGADYARLIDDYERRLGRYVKFAVRELKGGALQRGLDAARGEEADKIHAALDTLSDPRGRTVMLDSRGKSLDTMAFAEHVLAMPRLTLLVGGAAGFDPSVVDRADERLSLGKLTLPHQMARLVLTEQLYRAFRIARGEPYHY